MENRNLACKSMPRRKKDQPRKVDYFFEEVLQNNRSVSEIIFANLIVFSAIFLSAFVPLFSLALPLLFALYFSVGLWGFVYLKESDRKFGYEDLFVSPKVLIKVFCLFIIKFFSFLFWTICLIVPGVVYLLDHSFCSLILFESPELDTKGVLMLSKELVKGYRLKIFFFAAFTFASICMAISLMFSIIMFFDIFLIVPTVVYIVLVVFAGILDFITLALPLFQVVLVDCYISAKKKLCQV